MNRYIVRMQINANEDYIEFEVTANTKSEAWTIAVKQQKGIVTQIRTVRS